jgi:hypothetical protein
MAFGRAGATTPTCASSADKERAKMIDKESLRKMCEYPYTPSLVSLAIADYERPKPTLVVNNERKEEPKKE